MSMRLNKTLNEPLENTSSNALERAFAAVSPRLSPRPMSHFSRAIYLFIALLWLLLFVRAFQINGLLAWAAGIIYIVYDSCLIAYVSWQSRHLFRHSSSQQMHTHHKNLGKNFSKPEPKLTVGVVLAAHNEQRGLPVTLAALMAQSKPSERIIIADDGSTDDSATLLQQHYGLVQPEIGQLSAVSRRYPSLYWLRLAHGGKARALNHAVLCLNTDLIITLDADTLLAKDALAVMHAAFSHEPSLVAATGILTPVCAKTWAGRILQSFQRYEYMRNFIARFAWMQADSLLLISGAFAGFRRSALVQVGGFDPACLVEDYEVIHRLHRYSTDLQLGWRVRVLGKAHAITDAPSTLMSFLRQRRRWFAGFLQTQYWNRDMTGNRRYGQLGTLMLPIKAIDTLQPLYGLTAFALLIAFALSPEKQVLVTPIFSLIGAKIVFDFAFHLWGLFAYRRWTGHTQAGHLLPALLTVLIEPFSFQLLRHLGASWGWLVFITGRRHWDAQNRSGILRNQ